MIIWAVLTFAMNGVELSFITGIWRTYLLLWSSCRYKLFSCVICAIMARTIVLKLIMTILLTINIYKSMEYLVIITNFHTFTPLPCFFFRWFLFQFQLIAVAVVKIGILCALAHSIIFTSIGKTIIWLCFTICISILLAFGQIVKNPEFIWFFSSSSIGEILFVFRFKVSSLSCVDFNSIIDFIEIIQSDRLFLKWISYSQSDLLSTCILCFRNKYRHIHCFLIVSRAQNNVSSFHLYINHRMTKKGIWLNCEIQIATCRFWWCERVVTVFIFLLLVW